MGGSAIQNEGFYNHNTEIYVLVYIYSPLETPPISLSLISWKSGEKLLSKTQNPLILTVSEKQVSNAGTHSHVLV